MQPTAFESQVSELISGVSKPNPFDFDLERIPPQPNREMFNFLLNPEAPDAALQAVKAIYSFLFWEGYEDRNKDKISAALVDQDSLIRWIKDRADKGLLVFESLAEMVERASLMFKVSYERSGLQFVPDANEDVYEHFTDLLKDKRDCTKSTGEKSELDWAVEYIIPQMQSRGLDIAPLIGQPDFYTKFRHWIQAVRQRDRLIDVAGRRFDHAKKTIAKKLASSEPDSPKNQEIQDDLVRTLEQENTSKQSLLEDFEKVITEGFQDVVDPAVTVKVIDEKWNRNFAFEQALAKLGKGVGYTALINQQKTLLIAEFDYSMLSVIEKNINSLIDVRGMTEPLLIIRQLREVADEIEKVLGGG